jgi:hypothetical protein
MTEEELDRMTGDEAWDKCCYAAWVVHHQRKQSDARRAVLNDIRAKISEFILKKLGKL